MSYVSLSNTQVTQICVFLALWLVTIRQPEERNLWKHLERKRGAGGAGGPTQPVLDRQRWSQSVNSLKDTLEKQSSHMPGMESVRGTRKQAPLIIRIGFTLRQTLQRSIWREIQQQLDQPKTHSILSAAASSDRLDSLEQ